MFARVLCLQVRLEKKPDLAKKILKSVVPLIKQVGGGPINIFVLQNEIEVDKILVLSLWETKEAAQRYHAAAFERVRSILEPYLTYPPSLQTYTVDETMPWWMLTQESDRDSLMGSQAIPHKIVGFR